MDSPESPLSCSATCPARASLPLGQAANFSALNLLRSCNSVLTPTTLDLLGYYPPWVGRADTGCSDGESGPGNDLLGQIPSSSLVYPSLCAQRLIQPSEPPSSVPVTLHLPLALSAPRRPRSEKKPTPDDQKDQRYLERRRRNNRAAKKSRDARKAREDQIALRAALLEHENSVLRAQVMTLRDETHSLRQLLLHTKSHSPIIESLQRS